MKRFILFFGLILVLAMLTINLPFITQADAASLFDAFTTAGNNNSAGEKVDTYGQQQELVTSVVFVINQDQYYINNKTTGVKMDAKPFIESGRTFVPVRYLGNALGVDDDHIAWESPKVIFKQPDMPVVELTVGNKQLTSNGQAKVMDTAPMLKTGRTYLPARWVAEALGYQVEWDAQNQAVLCWPKGTEKPDVNNVIQNISKTTDNVKTPDYSNAPASDPSKVIHPEDGGGWTNTKQADNDFLELTPVN